MTDIFFGIIVSIILFTIFLFLFLNGIRKKSRKSLHISILFLLAAMATGAWSGYIFMSKAYDKVSHIEIDNPFKPRTGDEIYEALFRNPISNCVAVLNKKDQIVPRLDCCIWLEFKSCPAELKRIISLHPYKNKSLLASNTPGHILHDAPEWFTPGILGDTILMLQNYPREDPNHYQVLFISKDSMHAFYCDMAE